MGRQYANALVHISIHALLAESDAQCLQALCHFLISIHALLAESDFFRLVAAVCRVISIHALLAESDILAAAGLVS